MLPQMYNEVYVDNHEGIDGLSPTGYKYLT